MNRWEYHFGVPLDDTIRNRMEALGMVHKEHPAAHTPGFEKDTFTPDGFPILPKSDTVYPALLHKTIGIPVSENLTLIDPVYRQQAALAALKWTEKLFARNTLHWDFDGIYFSQQVHGRIVNFCFPNTSILVNDGHDFIPCMVIPLPESRHDDDYWEKGMIPQYAMMQAQLALWCSRQYATLHSDYLEMERAFLVRITGLTPGDIHVRTVTYDPKQADKILRRVARSLDQCDAAGVGYHEKETVMNCINWKDKKQNEIDNAYCLDSDAFHELIRQYMAARSDKKRLEEEAEAIKNQMDNIAIILASQIDPGYISGTVDTVDALYTVKHNAKSHRSHKISAELVRQLAPQYMDAIHTSVIPRGTIKIEVL